MAPQGRSAPMPNMCTHKPTCVVWLQTFRHGFSQIGCLGSAGVMLSLRERQSKLQCLERVGAGSGQGACRFQGDPKDGSTPAWPRVLAWLGSHMWSRCLRSHSKGCGVFSKTAAVKSSFWKTLTWLHISRGSAVGSEDCVNLCIFTG